MWIPGSGDPVALSEAQEDRPLLHPCHHKHVAVCQQETLAFIELQPPVTPKLNVLGSPDAHPLHLNGFKHTLNELNVMQNGGQRADAEHEITLNLNSPPPASDDMPECQEEEQRTSMHELAERPQTVTTVCRPLHAALSLPLSLPLSSLYTNKTSWDSPSSPEGPEGQSPDSFQPQRRTSQGSLKEKSLRECYLLIFVIFFLSSVSSCQFLVSRT